ncbi:uncharacterized protein LOC129088907 isoform X3 [Anoplopoma fimbria]|uniref:uncharacterized protein LOC129088907 isoform X3 n=1 Tax=Anoplopoma fimbria TaxID=229290 RepID=UPI0023ED6D37|nr:uncharacterized protein LOC129088907 isoform X3 [Anoplopoma fimbria]
MCKQSIEIVLLSSVTESTDRRQQSGRTVGAMKLLPVHPILWSSLLVLCASQSEMESPVCKAEKDPGNIHTQPIGQVHNVEEDKVFDNFCCLLYPTNILNCSWSFHTLEEDAQLFVHISICDGNSKVHYPNLSSERVGSMSLILREHENLYVILHFNITLHDKWTVYSWENNMNMLEVLLPPQKIAASFKDGSLLVTWGLPQSRVNYKPSCFEYQLDMGDQERPKYLTNQLVYTEPNADPTSTYNLRMRMRKMEKCQESSWSEWSPSVMEQSVHKLSTLVIVSISLGIPMILLAVLLLLRHQRVSKVLFPPIPCPPPKYKCFLEKSETFNIYPAQPADPEITEVEYTERKPEKT